MSKNSEVRLQVFTAPKAAENVSIHAAVTLPASGTTVVSTAITNPDVPRVVRVKGNASGIAGNVVVAGIDILGQAVTDTIALNGSTAVDGVVAMASITSITVPAKTNSSGDTVSVGVGAALALDSYCASWSFNNVPTALITAKTTNTTVISLNTITLAATLDGATDQTIEYLPHIFPTGRLWG